MVLLIFANVFTVNGEWAPLLYVATQCWHRKLSKQGDLIFLVPYTSCGVTGRVSTVFVWLIFFILFFFVTVGKYFNYVKNVFLTCGLNDRMVVLI